MPAQRETSSAQRKPTGKRPHGVQERKACRQKSVQGSTAEEVKVDTACASERQGRQRSSHQFLQRATPKFVEQQVGQQGNLLTLHQPNFGW